MRVLFVNSVCGIGSTGRICADLAGEYASLGYEVKIAYGRDGTVPDTCRQYAVRIGNDLDVRLHGIKSQLLDEHGLGSAGATEKFLKWADEYDPDILWMHNIHGYYINYELLFDWIKKRPNMEVKWTLHDCWAFTGHCSYFTIAKCDKWKTQCEHCPQPKKYPARLLFDNSRRNYARKKKAFCGVRNLKIITPSKWLAGLVKESFLSEYPVEVVYNTINRDVFKPTASDFRERRGLEDKKIILGVASPWDERKGLEAFLWLSGRLDDSYRIVLVGLSRDQIKKIPSDIIGIERTDNVRELVSIYTAADVFVNPTHEDNYPTTNLEAAACGTPVVTYHVGGSPESVLPENVVEENDLEGLLARILFLTEQRRAQQA